MILITKSWRMLLVGVLLSLWASNTFCLGNQTVTQSFDIESVCGVFLPLVTASGPSLTAQVNQPYGLAFTKSGLFVSDASNYVIRLIQGGQISTPIGNGEQSDKRPKGRNLQLASHFIPPHRISFQSDHCSHCCICLFHWQPCWCRCRSSLWKCLFFRQVVPNS